MLNFICLGFWLLKFGECFDLHTNSFSSKQSFLIHCFIPFLAGIDQYDRDSIINDFKNGICKLLVATSVAARGLDVKQLMLVVNYSCPNHYEDYVHRAGRTGRAGNKVCKISCLIRLLLVWFGVFFPYLLLYQGVPKGIAIEEEFTLLVGRRFSFRVHLRFSSDRV